MLPKVKFLVFIVLLSNCSGEETDYEYYHDEEAVPTLPSDFNICNLSGNYPIYCYCNNINMNEATEANCWIIDDMSETVNQHIWEGLSSQSGILNLTLHLRSDGILNKIPPVTFQHLPNMISFEVQYGTIKTVFPFNFANSSSLEVIYLSRNSIQNLEKNAFANLPALKTMTFGENHLTDIKRGVFSNLPKLTHLSMDSNNITGIEDRAFVELHKLLHLKLYSNQIKAIVPSTFRGLKNLQFLDLHMNRLEVIGDQTFRFLKSLQELDLHGNLIKYIAPDGFNGLTKLKKLNLQDNKLLSLGPSVFSQTTAITLLDLRYNVLETLLLESIQPLMANLNSLGMKFYAEGNSFRCDDRLKWIFELMNTTNSSLVKQSLMDIHCYLEGDQLPPGLTTVDTITFDYVTTPLGIGPKIKLLQLKVDELPDHRRTQIPSTIDPDCDVTENEIETGPTEGSGRRGGKFHRGGGGKRRGGHRRRRPIEASETPSVNEPQSDTSAAMSPPSASVNVRKERPKVNRKEEKAMFVDDGVRHQPREEAPPGVGSGGSTLSSVALSLVIVSAVISVMPY